MASVVPWVSPGVLGRNFWGWMFLTKKRELEISKVFTSGVDFASFFLFGDFSEGNFTENIKIKWLGNSYTMYNMYLLFMIYIYIYMNCI